jgi:PAS domain S-box-containing protein
MTNQSSYPNLEIHAQLAESEARYRTVIENASDMIQSVRPDGTFEFVNRAWLRKLGYAAEEVANLSIWDIIHPQSIEHCKQLFAQASSGKSIDDVRATFVSKAGQPVPIEGSVTSRMADDVVIATHGIFRDISERLRALDLEERNTQLEKEQLARYLEKMAALGRLSAGLAHELNNPAAAAQRASTGLARSLARRDAAMRELNATHIAPGHWRILEMLEQEGQSQMSSQNTLSPIEVSDREEAVEAWLKAHGVMRAWDISPGLVQAGMTEEALERLTAQLPATVLTPALIWLTESLEVLHLADVVSRSTHQISDLVTAVKAYSYMDRAAEQNVDVHAGIENTLLILAHRLKNITVMRDYDRNLAPVRTMGSGLNQVWTNILDNAVDAMNGRGTISIQTRRRNDRAVVAIGDDGCGIAPQHLHCIFEPFFTTKPQGQGIGLGLDTVWRIVTEEHHGEIRVTSQPGNTVFHISLPLAAPGTRDDS